MAAPLLSSPASADTTCGKASWYDLTSRTASGEMMDPSKLTAAHPNLPFGTKVLVTNKSNGRSVVVRINDRGPFTKARIIDLSKAAAAKLQFIRKGIAKVCVAPL
ncbi:MAG: septal ring lytic transglycosylase RlpA family protein [Rhodobacteraceae bacterium]|nr:septal ring lytic transglycosylase RlpA family protein [Paracoccaceae bacterium]